jgi:hypothetical protein
MSTKVPYLNPLLKHIATGKRRADEVLMYLKIESPPILFVQ